MDCDAFYASRRKARQPRPARQARDHRRRPARRRLDRLLHRADQGRALGHADVPGAEALPRGRRRARPDGGLRRGLPPDPRDDGGSDPRHRAAVARRGVPRPHRHRAAARRAARRHAGPPRQTDAARARHHRLHRPVATTSSSPRSPPTSTSRAAFRSSARRRRWTFLARQARAHDLGHRRGGQAALDKVGIRTFADLRRWDRAGPARPLRHHGRPALAPRPRRGSPPRRPRPRGQVDLERDHLLRRHRRPRPARRPYLAAGRKGRRPRQGQGAAPGAS